MKRVAVIGNAGGGKSTVARALAAAHKLAYIEVDALQWQPDWTLRDAADYDADHDAVLGREAWVLDGFGSWASVERRLAAADTVVLVDLPLWIHFWLAAERQISWSLRTESEDGPSDRGGTPPPAGHSQPPPTRDLFEMIWALDQDGLPRLRRLVDQAERAGIHVIRITSLEEQEALVAGLPAPQHEAVKPGC